MKKMKEIASPMKMYGKLLVTNASKRDPIVRGRINTTPRRMRLSEMIELRLICLPNAKVCHILPETAGNRKPGKRRRDGCERSRRD